jgi:hypothetical protein
MPLYNPNIDPACFPLLHIRGTQGFRPGLKKKSHLSPEEKEQIDMEKALAEPPHGTDFMDPSNSGTSAVLPSGPPDEVTLCYRVCLILFFFFRKKMISKLMRNKKRIIYQ